MAYPVEVSIGTANKVTLNYQSRETSLSVTYRLERGDGDLLAVVREKALEVKAAQELAWQAVRGELETEQTNTLGDTDAPQARTPSGTGVCEGSLGRVEPDALSIASPALPRTLHPEEQEEEQTKEEQTREEQGEAVPEEPEEYGASLAQIYQLDFLTKQLHLDEDELDQLFVRLGYHGYRENEMNDLTETQAARLIVELCRQGRALLTSERS